MLSIKTKKDETLEEIFNKYDSNFNKELKIFMCVYLDVEKIYRRKLLSIQKYKSYNIQEKDIDKKLSMELIYIKFEKDRLENNKLGIESNTNALLIALLILIITIGTDLFMSLNDFFNIIVYFKTFIIAIYTILLNIQYKIIESFAKKYRIYDVAIKVLTDLEKEKS